MDLPCGSGAWAGEAGKKLDTMDVTDPSTGATIATVAMGTAKEVDAAVKHAEAARVEWAGFSYKKRAAVLMKFHSLCLANEAELIALITKENGKNAVEAKGDLYKGLETVEWAFSVPNSAREGTQMVSSGVFCQELLEPVGVVACIAPFNFPFMVPMWTTPVALVAGNCVILKPSEKVPLTMHRVVDLMYEAGVPTGVFQMVNGGQAAVEALCDHPGIQALTFVGSSKVAEIVKDRASSHSKKVLALGGAKNHLVAAPDADVEMASSDIVASFAGCAGQRCMAAAVLLTVGEQRPLIDAVVAKAAKLKKGSAAGCVGPVIDEASLAKITRIIDSAEEAGAKVLLDGRSWATNAGHWVGPTILEMPASMEKHEAMVTEIFGPVLAVHAVASCEAALKIENGDAHGNAAAVYTRSGATADFFAKRFNAAMIGVNIGVPVPREPFSFGGMEGTKSKFGEHDITGAGGLAFFTKTRKITTKWSTTPNAPPDAANFGGSM